MRRVRFGHWLGWAYCSGVVAFLLLPVLIMVPSSFDASDSLQFPPSTLSLRWYRTVLGNSDWLASGWLSLRLALLAACIATVAGLMATIAHLRLGRIRAPLRAFLLLPLVAPHVVLAAGLFSVLLELHWLGSPLVLAVGHACLAIPITIVLLTGAADTLDPLLWTAASSLGARWPAVLRGIIIPNLWGSVGIAFALAFMSSWDEVTFAVFIGPTETQTLPGRMYSYLQELINPSLTAIATLLLAVTVLIGLLLLVIPKLQSATRLSKEES